MKYRELPNETERKGEQEESDRKKERGKRKGEKKRWGSEKLTLSFPESSAYSFNNSVTLTGKVPSLGQKGGYTRTHDAYIVIFCVVNNKMNLILEKLN